MMTVENKEKRFGHPPLFGAHRDAELCQLREEKHWTWIKFH